MDSYLKIQKMILAINYKNKFDFIGMEFGTKIKGVLCSRNYDPNVEESN